MTGADTVKLFVDSKLYLWHLADNDKYLHPLLLPAGPHTIKDFTFTENILTMVIASVTFEHSLETFFISL